MTIGTFPGSSGRCLLIESWTLDIVGWLIISPTPWFVKNLWLGELMITQTNYHSEFPTVIWPRQMSSRQPNWLIYLCSEKAPGYRGIIHQEVSSTREFVFQGRDGAIFQPQLQVMHFYFALGWRGRGVFCLFICFCCCSFCSYLLREKALTFIWYYCLLMLL